ncbi:hypothetical protein D3C81_787920 [compost metagenome]
MLSNDRRRSRRRPCSSSSQVPGFHSASLGCRARISLRSSTMLWVNDSENASLGVQLAASEWLREVSAFSASFSTTSTSTAQPPPRSGRAHGGREADAGRGYRPK